MFSLLRKLLGKPKLRTTVLRSTERPIKPQVDRLEDRLVLSLNAGSFTVNSTMENSQEAAATASSSSGMSVVVWHHDTGTSFDIRARLYDSHGTPATGEILVTATPGNIFELNPAVAMDANGGFVVVWNREDLDGTANDNIIQFARFSNAGSPLGGTIDAVANYSAGLPPKIASDAAGNLVIVYNNYNGQPLPLFRAPILARMYGANGTFQREVWVNQTDRGNATDVPSVARNAGMFVVVYTNEFGELVINRFKSNGKQIGKHIVVDGTGSADWDVDLDDKGTSTVVWTESAVGPQPAKVFARRVPSKKKPKLGSVTELPAIAGADHYRHPRIAVDRNSGDFVLAYEVQDFDDPDFFASVRVVEYSKTNTLLNNINLGTAKENADVSIGAFDDYLVAYSAIDVNDGDLNVVGRRGNL